MTQSGNWLYNPLDCATNHHISPEWSEQCCLLAKFTVNHTQPINKVINHYVIFMAALIYSKLEFHGVLNSTCNIYDGIKV